MKEIHALVELYKDGQLVEVIDTFNPYELMREWNSRGDNYNTLIIPLEPEN
jgi:hypothetical protein